MAVGTWLRPVSAILVGILVAFSTVALVQRALAVPEREVMSC